MNPKKRVETITHWIKDYCFKNNKNNLIIGISGGIDSAVTSTLCAKTGINTIPVSMPILKHPKLESRSLSHIKWLKKKFNNISEENINLSNIYENFKKDLNKFQSEHGLANSQARLRMTTLYQIATYYDGLVVGTGNKVEDFGIGFYTKYGDGGVDISPIADCLKTQVWDMGKELEILEEIIEADPTDGLWADGRTDQDQVGLNYQEIEKAMMDEKSINRSRYIEIRKKNLHKMNPIPICKFDFD
ncbi:MAG: NAD(+) synthase [Pelagibacteraceae bacterium]|nr:NAD(+) synthase [Pelagibacteraceae bacterium]|tara:strand:- start:360 stop:1094 length:735 start_codon:yes stop_codon:yes gene_type:complete